MLDVRAKITEMTPYVICGLQELEKINAVLIEMERALSELELGLAGALPTAPDSHQSDRPSRQTMRRHLRFHAARPTLAPRLRCWPRRAASYLEVLERRVEPNMSCSVALGSGKRRRVLSCCFCLVICRNTLCLFTHALNSLLTRASGANSSSLDTASSNT